MSVRSERKSLAHQALMRLTCMILTIIAASANVLTRADVPIYVIYDYSTTVIFDLLAVPANLVLPLFYLLKR